MDVTGVEDQQTYALRPKTIFSRLCFTSEASSATLGMIKRFRPIVPVEYTQAKNNIVI